MPTVLTIHSRIDDTALTLMPGSDQGRLGHFKSPLDRGVRYGVSVVRHDRKAELLPVAAVCEPVRVLVPLLAHAQRVKLPGLTTDDRFEERLDAGEAVGERAEDGGNSVDSLERVHRATVGDTGGRRAEAVEPIEDTWVADRPTCTRKVARLSSQSDGKKD